jgi:DNA-binding transcriptional LysR family regulator
VNDPQRTTYHWFTIVELTHLRYFFNVATTGSFAAGARLSHVTPPAMSKAIRKLEDELGAPLFERTTRKVALTGDGEVLLDRCRQVLASVDGIPRELGEARGAVSGELRIAAMEVFSLELLPAAIARLVRAHPGVLPLIYEMTPDAMERHLADGSIDIAFTIGAGGAAGVTYETLGASRGVVVCGRGHPLYRGGRVTRGDLDRHPFVVPRFFQRPHLPSLDQFPEALAPRRVGATIELLQMGVALAISGAYLGCFPEISVRRSLRDGSLRALRGLPRGAPFELRVLSRAGVRLRPAATALVAEVRSVMPPPRQAGARHARSTTR